MPAAPPALVTFDREAWAAVGAAHGPARPVPDPTAAPGWAGEAAVPDAERDAVVLPLARLAAVRRRHDLARRAELAALSPALAADAPAPDPTTGAVPSPGWVVGVAGGVAVGKSTIARLLAELLPAEVGGPAVVVSVDGFLRTNAELAEQGLTERKGAPETYDLAALRALLRDVRAGTAAAHVPVYAHRLQDRDPDRTVRVDAPAVLVLEGLSALAAPEAGGVADLVDLGIYVDAAEEDARAWYLDRFRAWRVAAATDEGALLHRIADMADDEADALALRVWDGTNAPNVREHVLPTRERADVVVEKGPDHRVHRVLVRPL
jgi:type I pantothenate kinase